MLGEDVGGYDKDVLMSTDDPSNTVLGSDGTELMVLGIAVTVATIAGDCDEEGRLFVIVLGGGG
jgi:hypothetical protein